MATVKTIINGTRKYIVNVTGAFSVSDETNVKILDKSTLTNNKWGVEPDSIRIDEITWAVGSGFDYVKLSWDNGTDEVIDYYQGQGYMDYTPYGGKTTSGDNVPRDVLLTTSGGASGDTYSLLINCSLKWD